MPPCITPKTIFIWIPFFMLIFFLPFSGQTQGNEEETKKQALKSFEDEDYGAAFKLYSNLLANFPKDPGYNYHFGVCMLYTDADKSKAIPYLKQASKNLRDSEKEALYFLGKAYQLSYQFDEALDYFNQYKQVGSSTMQKKLRVVHEMDCCKNAKRLLSSVKELVILDKKELSSEDFFRSYDLKDIGGKLLPKPSDFTTSADKKKKDHSLIFLPRSKEVLYYASYGTGDNKDIFIVRKLPNGSWSKAQNLGKPINTDYDEDYPFLHPNGKVLYFASQGHNSMGGFDLFKSELDPTTNTWKEPVNLEFPINSPNDDILFVTDSLEKTAYLSSNRSSPFGMLDVYRILTERVPAEFAYIKGNRLKKDASSPGITKIKIKNIDDGADEGTFTADDNGDYTLKLPNGGRFIFTVESPGFPTQSEGVNLPTAFSYKPYRQTIEYDDKKLKITNFFDANENDDNNYTQYLAFLKEKNNMEVNASDFNINPNNPLANLKPAKDSTNENSSAPNNFASGNSTSSDSIASASKNQEKQKGNMSNKQLVEMAFSDAKDQQKEANDLKTDATAAFSAANSKQDLANEKKQQYDEAVTKGENSINPADKQQLMKDADKRKEEWDNLNGQAATANLLAQQMEADANTKQKEANLNMQYAKALEDADKNKNNKQAIAHVEDLQKQLNAISNQKSQSTALLESIKADAENKRQDLETSIRKEQKLEKDIDDLKLQLTDIENQTEKTKDTDLLSNLNGQKDDLKNEITEKEKQSQINQDKIVKLKEESDALKSQADFAVNLSQGNTENLNTNTPGELSSNQNKTSTDETNKLNNTVPTETVATLANNSNAAQNRDTTFSTSGKENTPTNTGVKSENIVQNNNSENDSSTIRTTNQTSASLSEEAKKETFSEQTAAYNKALDSLKSSGDNLPNSQEKSTVLNHFVLTTDAELKNKKTELRTAKSNQEKNELNKQIKDLTQQRNQLLKDLRGVNVKVKEQEKEVAINSKKQENLTTENSLSNKDTSSIVAKESKADTTIANNSKNNESTSGVSNSTIQNSENDTSAVVVNNTKENDNNSTSGGEPIPLRDAKNDPGVKKANELLDENASRFDADQKVFTETNFTNPDALKMKRDADDKLAIALQGNKNLTQELSGLKKKITEDQEAENTNKLNLLNQKVADLTAKESEANQVADKAQGNDKVNAIKAAGEIHKQLVQTQYETAVQEYKKDDISYGINYEEIQKLSKNENRENNAVILEALQIAKKGEKIKLEAQKLREEGESEKEPGAKAGALGNADEKEKAALRKQKEALNLLRKINPETPAIQSSDPNKDLAGIDGKIESNDLQMDAALTALANANKAEFTALQKQYSQEERKNKKNTEALGLKSKALEEYKTANTFVSKSEVEKDRGKKHDALVLANNGFTTAINNLNDAIRLLQGKEILATNSVVPDSSNNVAQTNQEITNNSNQGVNVVPIQNNNINKNDSTQNNEQQGGVAASNPANSNVTNPNLEKNEDVNREYSDGYRVKADADETRLNQLKTQSENADNLKEQNQVLNDYISNITEEVAEKRKSEETVTNIDQKNRILKEIRALQMKKIELSNQLSANYNRITKNSGDVNLISRTESNQEAPQNPSESNIVAVKDEKRTEKSADGNTSANEIKSGNNSNSNTVESNGKAPGINAFTGGKGIESGTASKYSQSNPIPLNENIPGGLRFRVQIGAFRNPITQDLFAGLAPVGGENTPQGFIRYQVGIFESYQAALGARNDLRKSGYKDAFIVIYKDGKRVRLEEAYKMLGENGQDTAGTFNKNVNLTANLNIALPKQNGKIPEGGEFKNPETASLEKTSGVFFTIQIGVYNNKVSSGQLKNLSPIFTEQTGGNLYRYTAGIYTRIEKVKADKSQVIKEGINDAFVTAYIDGKRTGVDAALNLIAKGNTKFPTEQPIRFGVQGIEPSSVNTSNRNDEAKVGDPPSPVENEPFTNGVREGPPPTSENGVKQGDDGISFKVQIGAFRKKVPQDVADKWFKIKTWPVKNDFINGLYIYSIGSFVSRDYATKLQQYALSLGISDAFLVVYKDGKKLFGQEAVLQLNR